MATLTSTITESLTLNGQDRGSTNTLSIGSVTQAFHRIVTCKTGVDTTIAVFKESVDDSDGALAVADVKYIRVTNLDADNPVNLSLQIDAGEDGSAADESATVLLSAGHSFIMGAPNDGVAVSDANATLVDALHDLESILIDPLSNAVTVEVFIVS